MALEPRNAAWPALPYAAHRPTMETLHLWTQVVGKARLSATPWLNHSWHVTLQVSARGLATGPIAVGAIVVDIEFDFIAQRLAIRASDGAERHIALSPMSVAEFHRRTLGALDELGLPVVIDELPNELPDPTPFSKDLAPRAYDPAAARDFWRALLQADRVFKLFRTRFLGKASPCISSGAASTWR